MAKKQDETQRLLEKFDEILKLRAQARRAKVEARKLAAVCESKWLALKEELRAEPEEIGRRS
jgi:hypothetical protein